MEIRGRWRPWENPQLDRPWKSEGAGAHGKIRNWIGHGNPRALAPMGKSATGLDMEIRGRWRPWENPQLDRPWKSEGAGAHGKIHNRIGFCREIAGTYKCTAVDVVKAHVDICRTIFGTTLTQ
jgi:hypothetical protein